jgi:hypothetical protein
MKPRRALLALIVVAYAAVAAWLITEPVWRHRNTHLSSKERGHADQA